MFRGLDGRRATIYLGQVPGGKKAVQAFETGFNDALTTKRSKTRMQDGTAIWLSELADPVYEKLVRLGIADPRIASTEPPVEPEPVDQGPTLKEWLDGYVQKRTDVKPNTRTVWQRTINHLLAYFGPDRPLASINVGDALDFQLHMKTKQANTPKPPAKSKPPAKKRTLAANTVARTLGVCRQFFEDALEHEAINRNPFSDKKKIKTTVTGSKKEHRYYLTRKDAQKVLDACPDSQWRLIFALARFGGLRCPSELERLRWVDIYWDQARMLVHSPKTEHHEGKESRLVPLFPELMPHLQQAYDEAEPGSEYVIARRYTNNLHLRTHFERIVYKAGLKCWPKLFHNLRATRQTELTEVYPEHVVCAWLGNSPEVAEKHYLQVTEEDFQRAAGLDASATHNTTHSAPISSIQEPYPNPTGAWENDGRLLVTSAAKSCKYGALGDQGLEPWTR